MTRIEGVPRSKAGPFVRLVYRMARRKSKQIAGSDRELKLEPLEIYAHAPRLLLGYGMLEQSVASKPRVDEHLRALVVLKSAVMQGCEFCQDISSHEARRASVSDEQLLDLYRYRDSEHFDDTERLVLDLAAGMTVTPVQVSDELFAALRARFEDRQLVELVNLIALENLRSRFNAAFSIGAAGFSEGRACARIETPSDEPHAVPA
ncbi:MAG TPA: carboxymuconolactone decarboxylase family protein [Solirubrobacteraceae bacterium]|jgi:AhpD family alkylhydroperoxidase|nr:carboxymuconolactone decarboxylase family protein [Solirubrobacteraceae bacterium]